MARSIVRGRARRERRIRRAARHRRSGRNLAGRRAGYEPPVQLPLCAAIQAARESDKPTHDHPADPPRPVRDGRRRRERGRAGGRPGRRVASGAAVQPPGTAALTATRASVLGVAGRPAGPQTVATARDTPARAGAATHAGPRELGDARAASFRTRRASVLPGRGDEFPISALPAGGTGYDRASAVTVGGGGGAVRFLAGRSDMSTTRHCPQCGRVPSAGAAYCARCGARHVAGPARGGRFGVRLGRGGAAAGRPVRDDVRPWPHARAVDQRGRADGREGRDVGRDVGEEPGRGGGRATTGGGGAAG